MKTTLIADDSADMRKRIRRYLATYKNLDNFAETGSAAETISMIRKIRPEIIVSDFDFGDGTVMDILKQVRNVIPAAHCVVLTNLDIAVIKEKCLQAGADYMFNKTTEIQTAMDTIGRLPGKSGNE